MNRAQVVAQVATFFGGPYDAATHTYTAPTVPGLGLVRGAFHKGEPHADMWASLAAGTETGSLMIVFCERQKRTRLTTGLQTGFKELRFSVCLHVWTRSYHRDAEDAQADYDTLLDSIVAKIEGDPSLGSNGFEAGGFWFAEGDPSGITVNYNPPSTEKNNITNQYAVIEGVATHVVTG